MFQISGSSKFLFWNFDWFFELQGGIPIRITTLGLCLCPNLEALVKAKLLVLKLNLGKWVGMLLDTDTLRLTLRYVVLNQMLHEFNVLEINFRSKLESEQASKAFLFRIED